MLLSNINRLMRHKVAEYISEGATIVENTPYFITLKQDLRIITIDSYGGTVINESFKRPNNVVQF